MVQTSFQRSPTQEMMKLAKMRAYVNMCYPSARQTDEGLLFLEAPDDGHDPVMCYCEQRPTSANQFLLCRSTEYKKEYPEYKKDYPP